jgi:hypothetical protein
LGLQLSQIYTGLYLYFLFFLTIFLYLFIKRKIKEKEENAVVGISDSDMWRHKQGGSSCLANRNLELN